MNTPVELLSQIASYLNMSDLRNFRLVSRLWARVGISLIARNGLTILNTAAGLRDLEGLLQCKSIATTTRKLTISHGIWPVCSRRGWELHPLLFGGRSQSRQTAKADKAFAAYLAFIEVEHNRRLDEDVETFSRTLSLLPSLTVLVITHMEFWSWHSYRDTKYRSLQRKIWITPYVDDAVAPAVQICLLALSRSASVNTLAINGILNPAHMYHCGSGLRLDRIYKLTIASFQVHNNEEVIKKFLQAFPNLVELSVAFQGWGEAIPHIIGDLFWQHLKLLRFDELWASEDEMFEIFKRHQYNLDVFSLGNITIIQGSWRSLFTRIRSLSAHGLITADGELYGRSSKDTLIMNHAALTLLKVFMRDKSSPWPFGGSGM